MTLLDHLDRPDIGHRLQDFHILFEFVFPNDLPDRTAIDEPTLSDQPDPDRLGAYPAFFDQLANGLENRLRRPSEIQRSCIDDREHLLFLHMTETRKKLAIESIRDADKSVRQP